jgi:hypothetical protein
MYLLAVEQEDFEPESLIQVAAEWREIFGTTAVKGAA